MKKRFSPFLFVTLLTTTLFFSCKKEDLKSNVSTGNSQIQNSNSAKYQYYLAEIEKLRNFRQSKSSGPSTLGTWQTVQEYGAADGAGAIAGFKATAWYTGPAYGAAFGFLGGVFGSTMHYINKHYDYLVGNPTLGGDPFTNTYDNDYEKVGFYHNTQLLPIVISDPLRPASVSSVDSQFYNALCDSAAQFFGVSSTNLKNSAVRSYINNYLTESGDVNTPSEYQALFTQLSIDADVTATFVAFLEDVENGSESDVDDFVDLYSNLVQNDSNLTGEEKQQLLQALQVYNYSVSFWTANLQ